MNAQDIMKYGHLWVHKHVDGLTDQQMEVPGVCGFWSVKDILSHLTSFEWILSEIFENFIEQGKTPTLDQHNSMTGDAFNAVQVGMRQNRTASEVLAEYDKAHARVRELASQLDEAFLRKPGTLPWYGKEYALDDYIVYQFYGHKREHMAQVAVYTDTLK